MEPKTQVTVRLSADTVRHMDAQVANGLVLSRADYLDRAAEWQRRREAADRDAAILAGLTDAAFADLDGLAEHASQTPLDVD